MLRINPGRRVRLEVRPGSPDSAFLQGLNASGAIITYTRTQVGALENVIGTEGVIVTDSAVTRGGSTSIGNDVFEFEFNIWTSIKGGE